MTASEFSANPVLKIQNATLAYGDRTLWSDLSLEVKPHEFIAIIGANGSGKTALLRAILGQAKLSSGEITLNSQKISSGSRRLGYIPQNRSFDTGVPLLAKDLVHLGLDGHKFGLAMPSLKNRQAVAAALACVDANHLGNKPIGELSGGELQRIRVAQAVVGQPDLILADEPLSALDPNQQQIVADLLDKERREHNAAVLFVTHDVNPILRMVDRVLYLANGKFKIGTPDEVLRSEVLSELYGAPVDVLRNQGRIVVVGASAEHDHHDHEEWI
jgi:zinc/manganese transport system ATP-binding protein